MSAWAIRNLGHDFEAKLSIETRRLETVRGEDNLLTVATHRLGLGCQHQAATEALAPQRLGDPYLAQFARAAPGVPGRRCDDGARFVAEEHSERQAVANSGRPCVELVEPVFDERGLR